MRGLARGGDIAALLGGAGHPQGDAAEILGDAHAMTDVTGFGLAGHLAAICRASGSARGSTGAIPVFAGAEGWRRKASARRSGTANRRAAPVIGAGDDPRAVLLHDPQTAGGLLAAVAPETAEARLRALRAAGHDAAIIGHVTGVRQGSASAVNGDQIARGRAVSPPRSGRSRIAACPARRHARVARIVMLRDQRLDQLREIAACGQCAPFRHRLMPVKAHQPVQNGIDLRGSAPDRHIPPSGARRARQAAR